MANCNRQQLNITCGTDVVLHDRLIFDGETFDPNLSVGIAANLVSSLGKRTALDVQVVDDELLISVPWVDGTLPGCYGLEVTGSCNSKKWATYADSLIKYTKATRIGVSEVTVESDSYDITQEVGYMYSNSPVTFAEVTVDDGYGTPSVDVEYEQRVLSMAFHNLKGDPMTYDDLTPSQKEELKGAPGDSAIFDPETGNISQMKQTTGDDTLSPMSQKAVTGELDVQLPLKKPITFTEGEGVKSADGTLTTNSNFAYTVYIDISDYEIISVPIVKVSTTYGYALYDQSKTYISGGSADEAVSESGYLWDRVFPNGAKYLRYTIYSSSSEYYEGAVYFKVLKAAKNEIRDIANTLEEDEKWDETEINDVPYRYTNLYIRAAEKTWNAAKNNECAIIPVTPGDKYKINTGVFAAFLTSDSHTDETVPSFVDGTSLFYWDADKVWEVPTTTSHLYIRTKFSGTSVVYKLFRINALKEKISELDDRIGECEEAQYLDESQVNLELYPYKNGVYIGANDSKWHTGVGGNGCKFIPVNPGDMIKVEGYADGEPIDSAHAIFLKDKTYTRGAKPMFVDGVDVYSSWPSGEKRVVPSDANYLYVRIYVSGVNITPNVYEMKNIKSEISELIEIAEEGQRDTEKFIIQNAGFTPNTFPALRLVHFSDIHGDGLSSSLLQDTADKYADNIDDLLVTGDVTTFYAEGTDRSSYPNGWEWWRDCGLPERSLFVLGNHDGATINTTEFDIKDGNAAWDGKGQAWDFDTYIDPYADDLGIVRPTGYDDPESPYYKACFWHKDYVSAKVRLIGLDVIHRFDGILDPANNWAKLANGVKHDTTEQEEWLLGLLAEADSLGYSVVACGHYPMDDFRGGSTEWNDAQHKWICNQKAGGGYVMSEMTDSNVNFHYGTLQSNTLDRKYNLRNRVGTAESWSKGNVNNIANIIQAFINGGGKFVAYLCGHCHCDLMFYYNDILSIAVTQTGWLRQGSAENKSALDKTRLSANYIAFDTSNGLIKIARLGSKTNRLLAPINALCYDYINRKVISEW